MSADPNFPCVCNTDDEFCRPCASQDPSHWCADCLSYAAEEQSR